MIDHDTNVARRTGTHAHSGERAHGESEESDETAVIRPNLRDLSISSAPRTLLPRPTRRFTTFRPTPYTTWLRHSIAKHCVSGCMYVLRVRARERNKEQHRCSEKSRARVQAQADTLTHDTAQRVYAGV